MLRIFSKNLFFLLFLLPLLSLLSLPSNKKIFLFCSQNKMTNIPPHEFFTTYEQQDDYQSFLPSRVEFSSSSSKKNQQPPPRGTGYPHQILFSRTMQAGLNKVLVMSETGTGKTCQVFEYTEDIFDQYLSGRSKIDKVYYIGPSDTILKEVKRMLICVCNPDRYLTTDLIETAPDYLENKITKMLKSNFYEFFTLTDFYNHIKREDGKGKIEDRALRTQDDIDRLLTNKIIIIDEVTNLTSTVDDENKQKEEDKNSYNIEWYTTLLRRSRELGSKTIIISASPAVNEVDEFNRVFNLISDENVPVDLFTNKMNSAEDIYKYVANKVFYIRSSLPNVKIVRHGDPLTSLGVHVLEQDKYEKYQNFLVYSCPMIGEQEKYYRKIEETDDSLYAKSKFASSMIFPNNRDYTDFFEIDKTGGKGLEKGAEKTEKKGVEKEGKGAEKTDTKKKVTSPPKKGKDKHHTEWVYLLTPDGERLKEKFRDVNEIAKYSSKNAELVRILRKEKGKKFVYQTIVDRSGVYTSGFVLLSQDYEFFSGKESAWEGGESEVKTNDLCGSSANDYRDKGRFRLDKRKRFAIIEGITSPVARKNILELYRSDENLNGDYLEVLFGSKVLREGVNLPATPTFICLTPEWHWMGLYQATSRILRTGSFNKLGGDITVNIYYLAATLEDKKTSDIAMYNFSIEKNIRISRIMHILKRSAVDCYINIDRNTAPEEYDGTPECDYQKCAYSCMVEPIEGNDKSTFNSYFLSDEIERLTNYIIDSFTYRTHWTFDELYQKISEETVILDKIYLRYALEHILSSSGMINNRYHIIDKFGRKSYILESQGVYFKGNNNNNSLLMTEYLFVERMSKDLKISQQYDTNEEVDNLISIVSDDRGFPYQYKKFSELLPNPDVFRYLKSIFEYITTVENSSKYDNLINLFVRIPKTILQIQLGADRFLFHNLELAYNYDRASFRSGKLDGKELHYRILFENADSYENATDQQHLACIDTITKVIQNEKYRVDTRIDFITDLTKFINAKLKTNFNTTKDDTISFMGVDEVYEPIIKNIISGFLQIKDKYRSVQDESLKMLKDNIKIFQNKIGKTGGIAQKIGGTCFETGSIAKMKTVYQGLKLFVEAIEKGIKQKLDFDKFTNFVTEIQKNLSYINTVIRKADSEIASVKTLNKSDLYGPVLYLSYQLGLFFYFDILNPFDISDTDRYK